MYATGASSPYHVVGCAGHGCEARTGSMNVAVVEAELAAYPLQEREGIRAETKLRQKLKMASRAEGP